jgi:hypothetical protein
MPRFKTIDNVRVQCTPEEEAVADADAAYMPTQQWIEDMTKTDGNMPRVVEDILDSIDKSSIPQITLDRLQAKKDLRATKP